MVPKLRKLMAVNRMRWREVFENKSAECLTFPRFLLSCGIGISYFLGMEITFAKLLEIEKILMVVYRDFRFDMELADVVRLSEFLEGIGKVTDLGFSLQGDHFNRYGDDERLRAYHEKIMASVVEFDFYGLSSFIARVSESANKEELSALYRDLVGLLA